MKSIKDFINETKVTESNFTSSDFFKRSFVKEFENALNQIYADGADSDTDTALFVLFDEIIEKNEDLKAGFVGACEDIVKKFK